MDRYLNDKGEVAVLYTSTYGGGFGSSSKVPEVIFDPEIVKMVIEYRAAPEFKGNYCTDYKYKDEFAKKVQKYCDSKYGVDKWGNPQVYAGSASSLNIEWVPKGCLVSVENKHDGWETVDILYTTGYIQA